VTALRYGETFAHDLARVEGHLQDHEVGDIAERLVAIFDALELLTRHPLIGRPVAGARRELVIGRDSRGYVALYRYDPLEDEVVVLALRAQREVGFDETG
jgi:plasmid stabilization system protein ParE